MLGFHQANQKLDLECTYILVVATMTSAQFLLSTPWHFRGRGRYITDCKDPYQGLHFTVSFFPGLTQK